MIKNDKNDNKNKNELSIVNYIFDGQLDPSTERLRREMAELQESYIAEATKSLRQQELIDQLITEKATNSPQQMTAETLEKLWADAEAEARVEVGC